MNKPRNQEQLNQIQKNLKANRFFYISACILAVIVTVILILVDLEWYYVLIGLVIGVITHIIMIIQNKIIYNVSQSELDKATFRPALSSLICFLIKGIIIASATILIVILGDLYDDPNAIRIVFIYIGGYLLIKVLFIVSILLFKERG